MSSKDTFILQILTREGILFNEPVRAITAFNSRGKFDVLPHHANLVSLIQTEIIVHLEDNTQKRFELFAGLLQFIDNQANIFLGFKK